MTSSIATIPASVAGIFTIRLGASPAKCSACATSASQSRNSRGSVWIDSRPLRPRCSRKAGSNCAAAATDNSSTNRHPSSYSVAVGRCCASAEARTRQRSASEHRAASAITGLQVAPTAPNPIDVSSSVGSAESFHSTVGVVCVIRRSGPTSCTGTPAGVVAGVVVAFIPRPSSLVPHPFLRAPAPDA